jgi:nucleoid-associated protein YgaU
MAPRVLRRPAGAAGGVRKRPAGSRSGALSFRWWVGRGWGVGGAGVGGCWRLCICHLSCPGAWSSGTSGTVARQVAERAARQATSRAEVAETRFSAQASALEAAEARATAAEAALAQAKAQRAQEITAAVANALGQMLADGTATDGINPG